MKDTIHHKIEERKQTIHSRKQHLDADIERLKKRLTTPSKMSITALGGLLLGFLLLPKKFRFIRKAIKAYTMVAAAKQFLEGVHTTKPTRRTVKPATSERKTNVRAIHSAKKTKHQ